MTQTQSRACRSGGGRSSERLSQPASCVSSRETTCGGSIGPALRARGRSSKEGARGTADDSLSGLSGRFVGQPSHSQGSEAADMLDRLATARLATQHGGRAASVAQQAGKLLACSSMRQLPPSVSQQHGGCTIAPAASVSAIVSASSRSNTAKGCGVRRSRGVCMQLFYRITLADANRFRPLGHFLCRLPHRGPTVSSIWSWPIFWPRRSVTDSSSR